MTGAFMSFGGHSVPTTTFGIGNIVSGGGVDQDKYIKQIKVDMDACYKLHHLYRANSRISSAFAQFFRTIFRSELDIRLANENGKETPFDKDTGINSKYYSEEIFPCIEQMCFEWVLYGFTCVATCDSRIVEGAKALVVLPITDYTCQILWDYQMRKTYKVELTNSSMNSKMKAIAESARLIIHTLPDDGGRPSTPVALCGFRMISVESFWEGKLRESYYRSRPVSIYVQNPASTAALRGADSGPVIDEFYELEKGTIPTSALLARSEAARNEVRERNTKQAFHERQQMNLASAKSGQYADSSSSAGSSFSGGADPHMFAGEDPVFDRFVAPLGQRLERQLEFTGIDEFHKTIQLIYEDFHNALGIPMEYRDRQTDRGLQLMQKKLNSAIISFTKKASKKIERAFEPVLIPYMLSDVMKRAIIDDTYRDTDDSGSDDNDGSNDDDSGSSGDDGGSVSDELTTTPNRKRQRSSPQRRRRRRYIDNARLREEMRMVAESNMSLVVAFMTTPETNYELLKEMYQNDVITQGTFRKLAGDYADIASFVSEAPNINDGLYFSQIEDQREEKRARTTAKIGAQYATAPATKTSSTTPKPSKTQTSTSTNQKASSSGL